MASAVNLALAVLLATVILDVSLGLDDPENYVSVGEPDPNAELLRTELVESYAPFYVVNPYFPPATGVSKITEIRFYDLDPEGLGGRPSDISFSPDKRSVLIVLDPQDRHMINIKVEISGLKSES